MRLDALDMDSTHLFDSENIMPIQNIVSGVSTHVTRTVGNYDSRYPREAKCCRMQQRRESPARDTKASVVVTLVITNPRSGNVAGKLTSTCMALYFQQSLKVTATFQQKGGKSYPNFDITECLRITILCTHPFAPGAGDDVCEHATCGYAVHSVCAGTAGLGSAFAWQTSPKTSTFLDRSNMTRCI